VRRFINFQNNQILINRQIKERNYNQCLTSSISCYSGELRNVGRDICSSLIAILNKSIKCCKKYPLRFVYVNNIVGDFTINITMSRATRDKKKYDAIYSKLKFKRYLEINIKYEQL
jgi:hypothetical protein